MTWTSVGNYCRTHRAFVISSLSALLLFAFEVICNVMYEPGLVVELLLAGAMFLMTYLAVKISEFQVKLNDAQNFFQQAITTQTNDAVNKIVATAELAIGKKEQDVQQAVSRVVDESIQTTAPLLKLCSDHKLPRWLTEVQKAKSDKDSDIQDAANKIDTTNHAICQVFFVGVQVYADIAEIFLGGARRQVQSTTYYPNRQLVDLLAEPATGKHESQVRDWIKKVNAWANKDATRSVQRVHLFDSENATKRTCGGTEIACLHLHSSKQFVDCLAATDGAQAFYESQYAYPADIAGEFTFTPLVLPADDEETSLLPPECIVFDREVALMYDPRFHELKIFFGAVAQYMGDAFETRVDKCVACEEITPYRNRQERN